MRILFILQYVPYPLNSGGNQATFNMLDCIRKTHNVSLLFCLKSLQEEQAMNELRSIWKDVTFYPFKPEYLCSREEKKAHRADDLPGTFSYRLFDTIRRSMERKVNRRMKRFQAKRMHNLESFKEDFVRANSCLFHEIPGYQFPDTFLDFVYETSRKGFDLIQVEFYECLTLAHLLPEHVKKVFVQHEIRYVRNQNELDLFQRATSSDILRLKLLKGMELDALSRYDTVVALTEHDKRIMQQELPAQDIYVSPAAVTMPEKLASFKQATNDLIFIGGGDHFPNADGMIWFCEEVIPLLDKAGVRPRLNVAGKWGPEIKQKLRGIFPSINFTGFIDDLQGFINGKVSIVPIRIGSGMRMKILDSIFSAAPIVTTTKGCEGLPLSNGEDCYIADTAEQFAQSIARLLQHPEIQEKFVNQSQLKFNGMFSTAEMQKRRLELYEQIGKKI